jgi:hypothetical protein
LSVQGFSAVYLTNTSIFPLDDSWLNMSEKDLDSMLQNLTTPFSMPPSSHQPDEASQNTDSATAPPPEGVADLQSMAYGMTAFLEKVSSHTGAEFPW